MLDVSDIENDWRKLTSLREALEDTTKKPADLRGYMALADSILHLIMHAPVKPAHVMTKCIGDSEASKGTKEDSRSCKGSLEEPNITPVSPEDSECPPVGPDNSECPKSTSVGPEDSECPKSISVGSEALRKVWRYRYGVLIM